MRDEGTSKRGKGKKVESTDAKAAPGTEGKAAPAKAAGMTSKEKIAANQTKKRRK